MWINRLRAICLYTSVILCPIGLTMKILFANNIVLFIGGAFIVLHYLFFAIAWKTGQVSQDVINRIKAPEKILVEEGVLFKRRLKEDN